MQSYLKYKLFQIQINKFPKIYNLHFSNPLAYLTFKKF